jgi:hypothetical protein
MGPGGMNGQTLHLRLSPWIADAQKEKEDRKEEK